MPCQRSKPGRRSIRLKGYDYASPGAYFVTINVHDRRCLLGRVVRGRMHLNVFGRVAAECWRAIPDHFSNVELDAFVVMPDHLHGIIKIVDAVGVSAADDAATDDDGGPLADESAPGGSASVVVEGTMDNGASRSGSTSAGGTTVEPPVVTDRPICASLGTTTVDQTQMADRPVDASAGATMRDGPGMADRPVDASGGETRGDGSGMADRPVDASGGETTGDGSGMADRPVDAPCKGDACVALTHASTGAVGESPLLSALQAASRRAAGDRPTLSRLPPTASRSTDHPPSPGATTAPMRPRGPQSGSIGAIVGSFKSASAARINQIRGTPGGRVWQRNYWEHIVRNDDSLRRIRRYIQANPSRWRLKR